MKKGQINTEYFCPECHGHRHDGLKCKQKVMDFLNDFSSSFKPLQVVRTDFKGRVFEGHFKRQFCEGCLRSAASEM